jgi:hypothetical protein
MGRRGYALQRLANLQVLTKLECKEPTYTLNPMNPICPWLRAFLYRLAGLVHPKEIQPLSSDTDMIPYGYGLIRLFGGTEATHILLKLADGPLPQARLINGNPNLEPPLRMWFQSGVVDRQSISPGRKRYCLNQMFFATRELQNLLRSINLITRR